MWYLGRSCHLIEDITVPMHCRLTGNLIDIWQVSNHEQLNHNKFERYCSDKFIAGGRDVKLSEEFVLPETMFEIAKESRKYLKYCDGVGPGCIFNFPPLNFLLPWFVEDYEKAMLKSTERGEIYTVKLVHYFFQRVGVDTAPPFSDVSD